ncbi:hypothetical protein Ancab_010905, partial [Ancistrocladus abbreviatus]
LLVARGDEHCGRSNSSDSSYVCRWLELCEMVPEVIKKLKEEMKKREYCCCCDAAGIIFGLLSGASA